MTDIDTPSTQEPEDLSPKQQRKLHHIIWQYIASTVFFWVPIVVFLALANEVSEGEPLPGDVAILTQLNALSMPVFDQIFLIITALGSAPTVIAGVVTASATLWYLSRRRDALFLLFGAGGTAVINILFKLGFARERPDLWEQLVVEYGYSFPSGHAMISSALALVVILLTWHTKYRWTVLAIGVTYTLLVGLSRLYLGVHFPSDIIGGWCISILWIIILHQLLARYSARKRTLIIDK